MLHLRAVLLAAVAVAGIDAAALAADLPTKMPIKAPPVVGYVWDGFYIGGYYGASLGQATAETPAPGNPSGGVTLNDGGVTIGGTLGYNWTFAPKWLAGLEGDIGYLGVNRNFKEWSDVINTGTKASWYATARARLGYLTGPSLLYVTGGAAFVHVTDTIGGSVTTIPPTESSTTRVGWTAGTGIETKLSRSWSAKSEYLFIDAGDYSFGSNTTPGTGGLVPTTFHNHQYHVFKSGLNYNFGSGPNEGLPFFNTPMLPSDHNWGGFYAGVNVGLGISNTQANDAVVNGIRGNEDINGAGFAGGAQVGYNYMITPKYFVGVEGDFGYLGVRHSDAPDWNTTQDVFTQQTRWYATARGRIGVSTGPALLYFTGGGAWVRLQDGFAQTLPAFPGDVTWKTANGWTFGGGTEVALDARWSAKLESLYVNAGASTHNDTIGVAPFYADFKQRFVVVRAGLNYKLSD